LRSEGRFIATIRGKFLTCREGIVSKRLGSPYRSGRVAHWLKIKNPAAPAVTREAEEDWGRRPVAERGGIRGGHQ